MMLLLGLGSTVLVFAQASSEYTSDISQFNKAKDLFLRKQYTAAQYEFQQFYEACADPNQELCVQANYYMAYCAMELYHPDAENLVVEFITENPTSPLVNTAKFDLAKHFFQRKKYRDAKNWFEKVDAFLLPLDQQQEYHFKLGYGYFQDDNYRSAMQHFAAVNDRNSEFLAPAMYYTAHIHYLEKNYQSALDLFQELLADAAFGPIVPYYISQIYYVQEKYEDLLEIAESLMDKASAKRAPEVAKLIGESNYNLENYEEAIPYLEMYRAGGGRMRTEDYYQLGYAYYRAGMPDKAVTAFNKITSRKDSLAQNAYYHLADCYIKLDNKQEAKNAFWAAANLTFDKKIEEASAFNYAKLSYELGDPYYDPSTAIQDFVEKYPNSSRKEEAYEFLVNYFLSTRNYSKALSSLEEIGIKNYQMEVAYQKIAHSRGVQLYNNGDWKGAIEYFKLSDKYQHDAHVNALNKFWSAEAFFRLGKLDKSIELMKVFQRSSGATRLEVYNNSYYTLAYAYFKKEKYNDAILSFRRFIKADQREKYIYDATLRVADAYFMRNEYLLAIPQYDEALKLKGNEDDYASFQKAICLGLLDKKEEQVLAFETFLTNYERSQYRDDAHFEMGNALMALNEPDKAINSFEALLKELPNTAYRAKSLLNIALMHYNSNRNNEAISIYKQVTMEFPGTIAAKEAIAGARRVYVEIDQVQAYADWVAGLDFVDVSQGSLDSASFEAAEKVFLANDCERSIPALNSYLSGYPKGFFALQAHFYRAQCHLKLEDYSKALEDYEAVLAFNRNEYTEASLLRAAQIYVYQENYGDALNKFKELERLAEFPANQFEAQLGAMRAYYKTTNFGKTIEYANKVLANEKAGPQILQEAHLLIAKSAYKMQDYPLALKEFRISEGLNQNERKAESAYYIAQLLFIEGDIEGARKKVFNLIENQSDYPYWVSKSLLVLSRCYLKEQDYFNAEYTLGRLIDIVQSEDVKQEAKMLLEKVREEKERKDQGVQDTLQIVMD